MSKKTQTTAEAIQDLGEAVDKFKAELGKTQLGVVFRWLIATRFRRNAFFSFAVFIVAASILGEIIQ